MQDGPPETPRFQAEMDALRERILEARYAANTIRLYRWGWLKFTAWCQANGRQALPATPQACIDFALACIDRKLRLISIEVFLKAINHEHRKARLTLPALGPQNPVREFMRCARRALREKSRGKEPLTAVQLRKACSILMSSDRPAALRDCAILLVGMASGWRSEEIVSLDRKDIRRAPSGLLIDLGKSKTDQEGRGRRIGIHYGSFPETCPIRALERWLRLRGDGPGPLFLMCNNSTIKERRLDKVGVRRAVKRALDLIGEDSAPYGAHSLRSGMITAAIEAGASETAIMLRTGHKSYETLRRYVRPARAMQADPLAGVL